MTSSVSVTVNSNCLRKFSLFICSSFVYICKMRGVALCSGAVLIMLLSFHRKTLVLLFPLRSANAATLLLDTVFLYNILYFSDYKMHFPSPNLEENGGESYSLNVVYLAHCGAGGGGSSSGMGSQEAGAGSPLQEVLWSPVSYSWKIWYSTQAVFKIITWTIVFLYLTRAILWEILIVDCLEKWESMHFLIL